jgi:hypothetical protein
MAYECIMAVTVILSSSDAIYIFLGCRCKTLSGNCNCNAPNLLFGSTVLNWLKYMDKMNQSINLFINVSPSITRTLYILIKHIQYLDIILKIIMRDDYTFIFT